MSTVIIAIISATAAVFASSGFWAYITHRRDKNTAEKKILLGLAHDKLISQSTRYIHRGFISHEEYGELLKNLYEPYKEMGGNGTVEKMIKGVHDLEVRAVSDMVDAKTKFYELDKGGNNIDG